MDTQTLTDLNVNNPALINLTKRNISGNTAKRMDRCYTASKNSSISIETTNPTRISFKNLIEYIS